jgi:hypothetical protein
MITMVNLMVDSNTMRKARRLMEWFEIKDINNAVALIQYYPNYDYNDFEQLFEPFHTWDIDSIIDKILCPNPGLMKISIRNPKNIP